MADILQMVKELSVECHYYRTSRKLFNEKFKNVTYVLNYMASQLEIENNMVKQFI